MLFRSAFAADEAGIGGTAPGAQQAAAGIELQNGGSGFAAIRYGAVGAHLAKRVDRLTVLILCTGQWTFQPGFLVRQAARPVIDPDVVALTEWRLVYTEQHSDAQNRSCPPGGRLTWMPILACADAPRFG